MFPESIVPSADGRPDAVGATFRKPGSRPTVYLTGPSAWGSVPSRPRSPPGLIFGSFALRQSDEKLGEITRHVVEGLLNQLGRAPADLGDPAIGRGHDHLARGGVHEAKLGLGARGAGAAPDPHAKRAVSAAQPGDDAFQAQRLRRRLQLLDLAGV